MIIHFNRPHEGPQLIHLQYWSIREFEGGSRHLVGHSLETFEGRVSTALVALDAESFTAVTQSGRRYILVGPSGFDSDGDYVWNIVAPIIGNGQPWRDVTEEVMPGSRRRRTMRLSADT